MMNSKKADFIIIDDSELDCFIAEKLIRHSGASKSIKSFFKATEALNYIKESSKHSVGERTVILLDILMPIMSGIDFVEAFEKLPTEIQDKYIIVAFTSSMNKKDMARIKAFNSVKYLFDKPLNTEFLQPLFDNYL